MADEIAIDVQGIEELEAQLKEMIRQFDKEEVDPILIDGGKVLAAAVKSKAPRGPTGNLKKGIVAKQLNRIGDNPKTAFVGINYRRAPHAHLVEFGTSHSRPHPFFRPAVDANWDKVINDIVDKLRSLAEKAL